MHQRQVVDSICPCMQVYVIMLAPLPLFSVPIFPYKYPPKWRASGEYEASLFLAPISDFLASLFTHTLRIKATYKITRKMALQAREVLACLLLAALLMSKAMSIRVRPRNDNGSSSSVSDDSFCLSWRLAVEANNVRAWRTVPTQCQRHVESYMIDGQYERDVELIMEQISSYVDTLPLVGDAMDAWVLDVDDTCISNIYYYRGKKYGCDPYDPFGFRAWATKGGCPAISSVLRLFNKLVGKGIKVILVTGRDEESLGEVTKDNLHNQGFIGYERIILRSAEYKGQSAVSYKSNIRKQLEDEGYRIWGNVGDQWSDLQGDCLGNRTFKLPNPMYFVP